MIKINSSHISEFVGTFFLTAVVIGSGIMAENLSLGSDVVSLLGNTIATGAIYIIVQIISFKGLARAVKMNY